MAWKMISNFQLLPVPVILQSYVQRMFIIESTGPMPSEDLKLIVPNACPKLVLPFRNSLIGHSSVWKHQSKRDKVSFIGISDIPAIVDYAEDGPSGNITVEFSPAGAYRLFGINWKEIKNGICDYTVMASRAALLEEHLANTTELKEKVNILVSFLKEQLSKTEADPVFDYCMQQLISSKGLISVKELQRYTGYSSRWLNMKFSERIGLSPKNIASIVRFQQYYGTLMTQTQQFFLEKEFYTYYHDQAHFIKDFKRFTGYPPLFLTQSSNGYDKVFYKG